MVLKPEISVQHTGRGRWVWQFWECLSQQALPYFKSQCDTAALPEDNVLDPGACVHLIIRKGEGGQGKGGALWSLMIRDNLLMQGEVRIPLIGKVPPVQCYIFCLLDEYIFGLPPLKMSTMMATDDKWQFWVYKRDGVWYMNLVAISEFIVAKKWDPGILDPSRFSSQIRKVEARLGKLAKIRKVETD